MPDDNTKFRSLITESCNSKDLYILYRGSEDTEWMNKKLRSHRASVDIHDIDPCEKYEVRLATDLEPTNEHLQLPMLGPYYETLREDELTKVDLEDGEEYFKKHFVYGVSQLNKSSVTVDFGQACAMRMEVHRKREDEDFNIVGTFNSASTKVNV